jgi:hypothetical protein
MKRYFMIALVMTLALFGTISVGTAVKAEETAPMTETHIERIRSNCISAQSLLNQLHTSDALLRVDRGQLYELISTKRMAPFNSRVALNQLDSIGLPALALQYEQQLGIFRSNYQQYEEAMSKTLKINCTNQPVAFYDSLVDARTKRKLTHNSTVELNKLIQSYKAEFEVFAKKFHEGTR